MSRPIDAVLEACSARGLKVSTRGGWNRCPHPCSPENDGQKLSFAFLEQADGVVCCRSFKGYTTTESLAALGLKWADMYPPKVTTYAYHERKGRPVGYVKRTPDKQFPQGRYEGGKEVSGLGGLKLPLYMAPQVEAWLAEGRPVFIVEGEKDALSMAAKGFAAATKSGGAESRWEEANVEMFDGAEVTIVADKDESGERAAKAAYTALQSVAKSLRIVEARQGKDATDHLEAGFTPAEFVARDDLEPPPMTGSGRIVTCTDVSDLDESGGVPEGIASGFFGIDSKNESGGFPKGQMTVVGARKKHGKSSFMAQCACHALKAGHRVLYVTLADLTKQQVWRRMRRAVTGWADAPHDLARAEEWRAKIANLQAFWELKLADSKDIAGPYVEDLVQGIEALNRRHCFDLVFLDYVQKLKSRNQPDRVRATEAASTDLSYMAADRGFALVVGSQMSETGTTRYSQELEDDCGLMLTIGAPDGLEALEREFVVPYNRFGPSGYEFMGTWDKTTLTFRENA